MSALEGTRVAVSALTELQTAKANPIGVAIINDDTLGLKEREALALDYYAKSKAIDTACIISVVVVCGIVYAKCIK